MREDSARRDASRIEDARRRVSESTHDILAGEQRFSGLGGMARRRREAGTERNAPWRIATVREQGVLPYTRAVRDRAGRDEAEPARSTPRSRRSISALAESARTGQRWFDAELHRIRGEILLKQNPADPAPAEAAFLAAIAVAQQQKARSFELRAALSLAKLYQSTGRPIDAHDVLGPALEGFSPTPEFPADRGGEGAVRGARGGRGGESRRRAPRATAEIADQLRPGRHVVQGLRRRGNESRLRARRRARDGDRRCRGAVDAYFARWVGSFFRGELGSAREAAESFLREAERAARPTEAAAAHRCLGLTRLFQGDFAQARAHFEQALRIYDPERDREAKFRFGQDSEVAATAYLALAVWPLRRRRTRTGAHRTRRSRAQPNPLMPRHSPTRYIHQG